MNQREILQKILDIEYETSQMSDADIDSYLADQGIQHEEVQALDHSTFFETDAGLIEEKQLIQDSFVVAVLDGQPRRFGDKKALVSWYKGKLLGLV